MMPANDKMMNKNKLGEVVQSSWRRQLIESVSDMGHWLQGQ